MSLLKRSPGRITIAAKGTPFWLKLGAHYRCDGVDDDVQINAAVAKLRASTALGGTIELLPHKLNDGFRVGNPIRVRGGITLQGAGMQASTIMAQNSSRCDVVQFLDSQAEDEYQLFSSIRDLTINGNKGNNAAYTGTATALGASSLTDAGASWPDFGSKRISVEITTCTGVPAAVGQIRLIASNTGTVLTLDQAWKDVPDTTATYRIAAHGIAGYSTGGFDMIVDRTWTSFCPGHGWLIGQPWGVVADDMISEFNGGDGVRVELNATDMAAAAVGEGPKFSRCKFVRNDESGLRVGRNVYDAMAVNCELAGGSTGHAGFYMRAGRGHMSIGCRYVSHGDSGTPVTLHPSAGIKLGFTGDGTAMPTGCVIIGNSFRSTANGNCPYGIDIHNAMHCVITGNSGDMTTADKLVRDLDGRNTCTNNMASNNPWMDRTAGTVWLTTADNATVKFNPGLGNPAPIGCIPMLSFSPLGDAQRGYNAGTVAWCVAGTPERGTAILRSSAPIVGGTALYGFHVVAQYQNRQHVPGTA